MCGVGVGGGGGGGGAARTWIMRVLTQSSADAFLAHATGSSSSTTVSVLANTMERPPPPSAERAGAEAGAKSHLDKVYGVVHVGTTAVQGPSLGQLPVRG